MTVVERSHMSLSLDPARLFLSLLSTFIAIQFKALFSLTGKYLIINRWYQHTFDFVSVTKLRMQKTK